MITTRSHIFKGIKKLLAIGLIFLFTSLHSCKDDDKPQNWTRYEYLNQELLDYAYFKPGTWWVYKKIPGGDLDTIEVQQSLRDTTKLTYEGKVMYFEEMRWIAKSRLDDYQYKFYRSIPAPFLVTYEEHTLLRRRYYISKSKSGSYQGETNVIFYPFQKDHTELSSTHNTKLLGTIDTITIQEQTYRDVLHFDVTNDATFSWGLPGDEGGNVQYYWAPRVGMIKKEHMTKDIRWELVESHIVQG